MLMTRPLPGPTRDTPHSRELLAAISAQRGEWVNRREIAERMGKKKLTPWEVGLLALLVDSGEIEAEQHPFPGSIGFEWVYRTKTE